MQLLKGLVPSVAQLGPPRTPASGSPSSLSSRETPFLTNPVFDLLGFSDFFPQLGAALLELSIFRDARPCHTTALRGPMSCPNSSLGG